MVLKHLRSWSSISVTGLIQYEGGGGGGGHFNWGVDLPKTKLNKREILAGKSQFKVVKEGVSISMNPLFICNSSWSLITGETI